MEDDDDIYPENDDDQYEPQDHHEVKMEDAEEGEEGEELEDDSDDDINFITDAKEEPKPELGARAKSSSQIPLAADPRKASSTPIPAVKAESISIKAGSEAPDDKPGTAYPARHTSKLDPNGNPVLPATGKPIFSIDFDTDFPSDSDKPWRKPGVDITDYFNYGFDEFTWASYCLKQQQMPKEIKEINQQAEQMKNFVEGIPGGGMPAMPSMPGAQVPGMPNEAEMQQMFQGMMAQGMDPTTMDPNQFMQMMMSGGAGGQQGFGGGQPPSQPMGFGGGGGFEGPGGGGGGFSGRGRGRGGRRW